MAGAPVFGITGFLATDLGADWEPQSGDKTTALTHAEAVGNDGDVVAEKGHDSHDMGSETYVYIGSASDYGTATTGALDAAGALPGKFLTTAAVTITSVTIDYGPCASGQRETVTFNYSEGLAADSAVYKPSLTTVLATKQENAGVPALFTNANTDSKCQTASYTIECQEGRTLDKDGEYLAGSTYKGQESVSATYVGVPALTTTDWIVTSLGGGAKSNTGYDTYPISAVKRIVRT
jgi:hypothetical protein